MIIKEHQLEKIISENAQPPNILIYGPESFKTTFNELKPYLKFNLTSNKKKLSDTPSDYDGIICFDENLNKNEKDEIRTKNCFKVLATLEPINNDKYNINL